jgi:hypothetical protein
MMMLIEAKAMVEQGEAEVSTQIASAATLSFVSYRSENHHPLVHDQSLTSSSGCCH